jgi:hypothetical protein
MSSVPWIGEKGKSPYRFVKTNEFGYIHHTNLLKRTNTSGTVDEAEAEEKAATNENENAEGNLAGNGEEGSTTNKAATASVRGTNSTNTATNSSRVADNRQDQGGRRGARGQNGRGQNTGNRRQGGNNNRNGGGGDEDHWSAFATERREIADFIKSNHIEGVCILHGDSHMLAADDGSHSDYATGGGAPLPVMCAAPLEQNPSMKGGPYSQGVYRVRDKEGEGAFGLLSVTDKGDHIEVAYSGRNNKNEEKISLKFSVPANAAKVANASQSNQTN